MPSVVADKMARNANHVRAQSAVCTLPPPPLVSPLPAAGNGQWINSGETRASVKQICDGGFTRAWVIFGRRGEGRKWEKRERKEKYRFCWTTRDIDVKKKNPPLYVTLCLAAKFRESQSTAILHFPACTLHSSRYPAQMCMKEINTWMDV